MVHPYRPARTGITVIPRDTVRNLGSQPLPQNLVTHPGKRLYAEPVTGEVIPDQATAYGERVRRRLTGEMMIWLTTTGRDGTPQPNPVGFLWDGGDSLLIYSQAEARRLPNIRRQPRVSLHFDSNGGDDIVVLTGTAEILDGYPAATGNPGWLQKYGQTIDARFGSATLFAETFSVPVRIHLTRVRGF